MVGFIKIMTKILTVILLGNYKLTIQLRLQIFCLNGDITKMYYRLLEKIVFTRK